MKLVIDANCLFAGLLKDSTSRKLILSDRFQLYAPDYLLVEFGKFKPRLQKKSGLMVLEFDKLLTHLFSQIQLVNYEEFEAELTLAIEVMKDIDLKDAPFLAVGIALGLDGIWTMDNDFQKQDVLPVFSTADLFKIFNSI